MSNSMISAVSNSFLVVMSELALMISLGANANGGLNLTLWENYDRIGEEKVLYDIPQFAVSLKQDIAKQISSSAHETVSPDNVRVSILDITYLIPALANQKKSTNGKAGLRNSVILVLLLAANINREGEEGLTEDEAGYEASASLWVHMVEVPVPSYAVTRLEDNRQKAALAGEAHQLGVLPKSVPSSSSSFISDEEIAKALEEMKKVKSLTIVNRLFLTKDDAKIYVSSYRNDISNPKLFTIPPNNWRVYISWVSFGKNTLQALQIDILNHIYSTSSMTSTTSGIGSSSSGKERDIVSFQGYIADLDIPVVQVLTMQHLKGVDGFCALVSGTHVYAFFNFLPNHLPNCIYIIS